MAPPAPKIALGQSAAVFVGRVTSVEKGDAGNKYNFAISKQWKGIKGKTASIATASNSAACGINFDEDRDYLVYAYQTEGDDQLRTNLCTRTARLSDAAADLTELGAPLKAAATQTATYPMSANRVVQVNAKAASDPLVALARAINADKSAAQFRVNWTAPTGQSFTGTSLYNRADSTLKSYSRSETKAVIAVSSVLYSGVNDAVLQKLASTDEVEEFFRTYAKYGVTKKDLGSKTVLVSARR